MRAFAVAALILVSLAMRATALTPIEPPALEDAVLRGELPPVAERLPAVPLVAPLDEGQTIGAYGGELHTMVHREKDTRLLAAFGYTRLVVYDRDYVLRPDLLESVAIEGDRVFTLHLRPGHKWSDGAPFTSEDFRYWWEDVANDQDLSPSGLPQVLLVDGEAPMVEFPDATTVRYTWSKPNPFFLPACAATTPLFIYAPAHYLKPYHPRYADPAALAAQAEEAGKDGWAALHNSVDNLYRFDNPALPTLHPWTITNAAPAKRFVAVRNPYYHRVDAEGRQLPYIDRVVLDVVDSKLIPAKTGAGEAALQARGLSFGDYTFLKEAEERNKYRVHLWRTAVGSAFTLYPNLNVADPAWRALVRDVRFRRALSLAVNRHEVNQVIFYGLANEAANTVLPESPLFRPEYRDAYAAFDLIEANRLLDAMGLSSRDGRGVRLLADGRPLEIVVETAGEDTTQTDVLELIHDSWMAAGVKLYSRPMQREVLRNRVFAGQTVMSVWTGYENGVTTAGMSPFEFAPTTQQSLQWPAWGQYFETAGESGEPVDLPEAQELMALNEAWRASANDEDRAAIWHRMLAIHADQVYTIGVVSGALQPVVVSDRLNNVPTDAIFNWEPGAQFGVCRADQFWFTPGEATLATN
ncbi:MAG: ABC transporter substrate-binding protein [Alphaproteobacteria bacterium]|nr:ABC transporter substrate-binding protein [Alphaproteobacteria bacterium]